MPWKIGTSVVRGEIDNRQKGRVSGRLWLHGQAEPLELELRGNACPDLAGCHLAFENPGRTYPLPREVTLQARQIGAVGDFTASRKVLLRPAPPSPPAAPTSEAAAVDLTPVPSLANSLYLEWYSEPDGRVLLEGSSFRLRISPPAWQPTPAEEIERQAAAAAAFSAFLEQLSRRIEGLRHEPPEDQAWDEFDYEKLLRESDARTDKLTELYEKHGDRPDVEQIIAREMGWSWLEEGSADEEKGEHEISDPAAEDTNSELDPDPDSADLEPDPATEGVDWVRTAEGYTAHPLSLRVFERSVELSRQCQALAQGAELEPPVDLLVSEFQITGAKLAGALNGLAYGRDLQDGAFVVATLKRALSHLHRAQEALATVVTRRLLPSPLCDATRTEFFAVREEILRLMQVFRGHPRED